MHDEAEAATLDFRPALGLRCRVTTPADATGGAYVETVHRLVRAGKIRRPDDPRSLVYLCMSAVKHRPDVAVKPPQWLVNALAAVGRRLGWRLE